MEPSIDIWQLGKQYKLASSPPYIALRDVISHSLKNAFGTKKKPERFWALQDIDLKIEPGSRLGIIGKNGAGKSTLLKIISRITPPTTGQVTLQGRVGSLLEIGTGFHPELTGRENIYLNGSILGLRKREINQRLEAIIDFSGVEKFIDSPLKHYSSGMQMRLAFAVAAHLDAEILLIDEVLAVGDMEFQKKCLGKMEEVSKQGRTILFVSHNMNYIAGLCEEAILLDNGKITARGKTVNVIDAYMNVVYRGVESSDKKKNEIVQLKNLKTITEDGNQQSSFNVNQKVGIEMEYEVMQEGHVLWLGFNLHNQDGVNIFDTHSVNTVQYSQPHAKGVFKARAWIPSHLLNTGNYFISCAIFNHLKHVIHLHEKDIGMFTVQEVFDDLTARGNSPDEFPGVVRPLLNWEIQQQ